MNEQLRISRRTFLLVGGAAAVGAALAACAQPAQPTATAEPAKTEATPAPTQAAPKEAPTATMAPAKENESPVLAEQVAAGNLPALDERLPAAPMVVDRTGKYGGTLRLGATDTSLFPWDLKNCGGIMGTPLRLSENLQGVVPNVWESYEISDDFTILTGHMRQGLKWNDGAPHTADDWVFWYEDFLKDPDLTPTPGQWFMVGGTLMDFEKLDDYTVRMTFHAPNPSFPMVNLAHCYGFWDDNALPRHYLEQYHIKYNEKAEEDAKAAGFDFWYQLFGQKRGPWGNAEVPRLGAYIVETENPDGVSYVRNAYYWLVDSQGNQLSYFDAAYMDRVDDATVIEAKAVTGEYDYVDSWQLVPKNYQTYKEGEATGGYKVYTWKSGLGAEMCYNFNMNYQDEVWRNVFSDKRFRQALSIAINRDEINEVLYFGLATPCQLTAHPTSRHYKPEYAEAWAQYDPDTANQMLDEIGLKWDDNHELRLLPDGRPMKLSYDSQNDSPIHELVGEYWKAVGIQVDYKVITRTLLRPKIQANEEPMSNWNADECIDVLLLRRPKWFAPIYGDESTWAPSWGLWYNTKGKEGEEPPPEIKQLYEWIDKYMETDANEWADNCLASQAENIWTIGTVADGPSPLIINKDMANVAEMTYYVWDNLYGNETYPEAWYYDI
jgi:peptide/nickel transport system substrate-binding protein